MRFVSKEFKKEIELKAIVNVHYFKFTKNFSTKNDIHPFCELIFVSNGTLNIRSDEYNGLLKEKQIIIHKENQVHSLFCDENEPTVIIIGFVCDSNKLKNFSKSPITLNDEQIEKLAEIVKEGRNLFKPPYDTPVYDMKEKENPVFASSQMIKILLEYFLIQLIRENNKEIEETDNFLSKNQIVNYINENFLEKITIDKLAFLFGTNRSTLCKEFKIFTGKTINEYIDDKKITLSKELLNNGEKTITEIAEEMNFSSVHYFSKFFQQKTGLSPTKYKDSEQNKINKKEV